MKCTIAIKVQTAGATQKARSPANPPAADSGCLTIKRPVRGPAEQGALADLYACRLVLERGAYGVRTGVALRDAQGPAYTRSIDATSASQISERAP
jgi:hypothetical protein